MRKSARWPAALATASAAGLLILPALVFAHCDTLDGPVVRDARTALEQGDVAGTLRWVRPSDEAEIRAAFTRARTVRALGGSARDLADRWFFETVVRVHRTGEGAPYTGLKERGTGEAGIALADQAIELGSVDALTAGLRQDVERGVRDRFARVLETRRRAGESVAAGRDWVEAYVEFVHYVDRLHGALAAGPAHAAPAVPEHTHP
jgi:hypothetical protein